MPKSRKRSVKKLPEVLKVLGNTIGQASLEVCPDPFIGVKLRRIAWEVKGLDSRTASKEFLGKLGFVERAAVPEEDERSLEVTAKVPEKLSDLLAPEVLVSIKACIESEAFPLRRDRDGGDSRDFCPASSDNERWRFPFNRPGSLDVGDKRESTLIQEYQAGSKPFGLFLYGATRDASSIGSLARGALWPASAVFGSSNPGRPSDSKGFRCNSVLRSSCAQPSRYASRSKDPSSNRLPEALSPGCAPRSSFSVNGTLKFPTCGA